MLSHVESNGDAYMPVASIQDTTLTAEEAAELIGLKPQSLAVWRMEGRGPRFRKVGRLVRYSAAEVAKFLEQQTCGSTNEAMALANARIATR